MEVKCQSCRFFRLFESNPETHPDPGYKVLPEGHGFCHRFPPQYHPLSGESLMAGTYKPREWYCQFPVVYQDEWCGEFQELEPDPCPN